VTSFAACSLPTNPTNGEVNLLGTDTSFGQYINYTCNTGYILNGTALQQCLGGQTWSDMLPSCVPMPGMLLCTHIVPCLTVFRFTLTVHKNLLEHYLYILMHKELN